MTAIKFEPMEVLTDGGVSDGRLVLANGKLIAVLVHVMPSEMELSAISPEGWYREAGFGPCSDLATGSPPPLFNSLEEARGWIEQRIYAPPLAE
jgi:hypothetical protein